MKNALRATSIVSCGTRYLTPVDVRQCAMREVWPATREQRCCVHKTANVLDKLPKRLQPTAKEKLHNIWMADTRAHAQQAFDLFLETYQAKLRWS